MKKEIKSTNSSSSNNKLDANKKPISTANNKIKEIKKTHEIKLDPQNIQNFTKEKEKADINLYMEFMDSYNKNDYQTTCSILKESNFLKINYITYLFYFITYLNIVLKQEPDNQRVKELLSIYEEQSNKLEKEQLIYDDELNEKEFLAKNKMKINENGEYECVEDSDEDHEDSEG